MGGIDASPGQGAIMRSKMPELLSPMEGRGQGGARLHCLHPLPWPRGHSIGLAGPRSPPREHPGIVSFGGAVKTNCVCPKIEI